MSIVSLTQLVRMSLIPAPFTFRSFFVGAVFCLGINIGFAYARLAMATAGMSSDYITAGAVFLFFVLTALLNPLIRLVKRSWGFSRAELIVIYAMMLIASAIPTWGFTGNLIAFLPNIYYYATPENNWAEWLHPYLREWMVPHDPDAIKYFFEGLPKGQAIPWGEWLVPLAAWCSFILAIYLMMISIMSLMRRQWVDYDRLSFPLLQLPLDLVEEGKGKSVFNPFVRNPLMWAGFAIPFLLFTTSALNHYYPFVPAIPLRHSLSLFNHALHLQTNVNFVAMGLAYFLSLDVGMSIWLFYLLTRGQLTTENILGYDLPGRRDLFMEGSMAVSYQGMGAMLVLVLYGLWTSRRYLRQVAQQAWHGHGELDDSEEILSYRAAALVLVGSSLYAVVWLWLSGLPLLVTLFFLFIAFCIFYGLTRIVAEGGLGFARAQMTAQPFVIHSIGTEAVTAPGILSLGFTFSWAGDLRTMVMASAINGMKLADSGGVRRRPLFWAMVLAIAVSLAGSVWAIVWMGYTYGGINLDWWFYNRFGEIVHGDSAYKIANPSGPVKDFDTIAPRFLFAGIGAGIMGLLMFARHHFLWWPVHYLGFPIGATLTITFTWFSIFIGWMLKALILKYGGVALFRRLRPFFLGLILGHVFVAGFWVVIDFFTGQTGNRIPIF
ncbi:MAG: hypothetical protein GKR89_07695 [Candidatus Latescibacteria bacterium]|nr:hypothetical protein [Candidatus Latescibacterota bacterium]